MSLVISSLERSEQFSLVEKATEIKLGRTFLDKLIMEYRTEIAL